MDSRAGFFGKVMSHGDFVTRRLPHSFVQPWDDWLQMALHTSRGQLGTAWLGAYLSSPIWRFALDPGVCDTNAWVGLLMPSVDRVGRHFPLTIAARMAGDAMSTGWMIQAAPWFERLETLALWSLQSDFALELYDEALSSISTPPGLTVNPARPRVASGEHCNSVHELPRTHRPGVNIANSAPMPTGQSRWWTDGSEVVASCLLQCQGLPDTAGFAAMLNGQWEAHGWQIEDVPGITRERRSTSPSAQ